MPPLAALAGPVNMCDLGSPVAPVTRTLPAPGPAVGGNEFNDLFNYDASLLLQSITRTISGP
jgi:hypothetical protein